MSQGLSEGFHFFLLEASFVFSVCVSVRVALGNKAEAHPPIRASALRLSTTKHMRSFKADGASRLILTSGQMLYLPKAVYERDAAPKICSWLEVGG